MMKKTDPSIKKTFVRTSQQRILGHNSKVIYDVEVHAKTQTSQPTATKEELNTPKLCSSEALATYLTDAKKSLPQILLSEVSKVDKIQLSNKVTKKLNFHFDDRIYKNLVQLNADVANVKNKKEPRSKVAAVKKDLEPNIEDFYHDEKEEDLCPKIPVIKPKFRPIRKFESGELHELTRSFELL
ncbi:uncharacterized protein LOC126965264 [Leptidea sinapis]|uniref:uncharacterized protein LOC126965264 n=1 Tax=Leptidea sinapis TaxID=189913 RepID=UPI002124FEE0|nr:uncharacterized protein LOC126965264 [Leptidea sinapis]